MVGAPSPSLLPLDGGCPSPPPLPVPPLHPASLRLANSAAASAFTTTPPLAPGKQRRWDAVESHSSVGVVIFHTGLRQFVLVRQFRPPVYATMRRAAEAATAGGDVTPLDLAEGFTYELCAGILDKDKSLEEITCEEIEVSQL